MQLDLATIPATGTKSFNLSINATTTPDGKFNISLSQSVNFNDVSGNTQTDSSNELFKGTIPEVKAKLATLGLDSFIV
jgi:hypothetical protein